MKKVDQLIAEINARLDKPVRPYGDPNMEMSTERQSIRGLYSDDIIDDIEGILAAHATECAHKQTHMRGWRQVCDVCGQGRDIK